MLTDPVNKYRVYTPRERQYSGPVVGILLVGDEILSGSVRESNLHLMITTLERIGYSVAEVRIVRDQIAEISQAFRELTGRYEIVISAGGIGPTHDDVTIEGLAVARGVSLSTNDEMLRFLRMRYGEPLAPMVARMAQLPPGTEVLGCAEGHWPVIRSDGVYLLPGLPVALADKMRRIEELLPRRDRTVAAEIYLLEDESEFADWLDTYQRELDGLSIGSYPVVGAYDYRSCLVVRGLDRARVTDAGGAIAAFFRGRGSLVRVGGALGEDPVQS